MEKPMPGCMGRVVHLFDLGSGISGNKLLTEKPHQDRFAPPRGQPHVAKNISDAVDDHIKDKLTAYESKRNFLNRNANGTPMKMLIAQEMLKEPDCKRKSPNVVAKLMGLDALPPQGSILNVERSSPAKYSPNNVAKYEPGPRLWQEENGFPEIPSSQSYVQETQGYKDVYEVRHQSLKTSHAKDRGRQKTRQKEDLNEKMALVRQKFMEAKRLSTDEKLRQSKEFHDALDVLSSNRDVFLKFLQEPNSLLSSHLYEFQYIASPPESKRITVLRPAKAAEVKGEKMVNRQPSGETEWDKNSGSWTGLNCHLKGDTTIQPTRIVVLKPSPGKTHEIKSFSSPTSPQRSLHGSRELNEEYGVDGTKGSREMAKEMTRKMRKNLSNSYGDDSLISSVLSNGYVGDQSSFNKSENESVEEENFSDSDIVTPNSRHTWDYINRYSSPFSSSSFSRASYSPESSVSKEAKKRLSERWAMMASNGSLQEIRQVHRSSSTLGEMLSLQEAKLSIRSGNEAINSGASIHCSRSCGGEQELGVPSSCLSKNMDECREGSPRNLVRSRSAPVSSRAYEIVKLNVEPREHKIDDPKGVAKPKSGKSSFKGKVSSLFFSRNKKPNKEKSGSTPTGSQDVLHSDKKVKQLPPGNKYDDTSACSSSGVESDGITVNLEVSMSKASSLPRHGSLSSEGPLPLAKTGPTEQLGENQEQPSPISVLDAPFDEDVGTPQSVENADMEQPSYLRLVQSCEATAKSPLIESITRSLSWDDESLETPSSISLGDCMVRQGREVALEREWFLYVHSLLSAASLDHENSDFVFTKWHSPESPLDPSLADKCTFWRDDEQLAEAKRRQRRSDWKLLFDSVNAALLEMVGLTFDAKQCVAISSKRVTSLPVTEEVWGLIKKWLFDCQKICCGETENGLVVEKVVREEIVGRGWEDLIRLEVDNRGKEIEKHILEEIIDEALAEMA